MRIAQADAHRARAELAVRANHLQLVIACGIRLAQQRQRQQHCVTRLRHHKVHLRAHPGQQLLCGIGDFKQDIVKSLLALLAGNTGRHRDQLTQFSRPLLARIGGGREIRAHALAQARHIDFGHLRLDRQARQVGNPQQRRGLLAGAHHLSGARRQRHHGAGNRRPYLRMLAHFLIVADGRFGLADLRIDRFHPRRRRMQAHPARFEGLFAGRIFSLQLGLAVELQFGKIQLRALIGQLGPQPRQLRPIALQPLQRLGRRDLEQQPVAPDLVADHHLHVPDLARDLRADIDIVVQLQLAVGQHRLLDRAALQRDGLQLRRLRQRCRRRIPGWRSAYQKAYPQRRRQQQCSQQDMAADTASRNRIGLLLCLRCYVMHKKNLIRAAAPDRLCGASMLVKPAAELAASIPIHRPSQGQTAARPERLAPSA